jgi:hypothetical protein
MRAESTPPMNNSQSQQSQIYSRARSEQPVNVTIPTQSPFQQNFSNVLPGTFPQQPGGGATSSSYSGGGNFASQSSQYSVSQQIQRNNTNFNNRNFRTSAQRSISNTIYEQQQQQPSNCYQQPQPGDAHSNNFMNLNNPLQEHQHHPLSAMNNNSIQNNIQTSSNNSNLNANNLQYHQNLSSPQNNNLYMQRGSGVVAATPPPPPSQSRATVMQQQQQQQQQQQSTPALNNQVMPGNRANNYWDNFRR